MTRDLSNIIKAYDVRGLCPGELDADIARALGRPSPASPGARASCWRGTCARAASS
jgi:hypothetical protein